VRVIYITIGTLLLGIGFIGIFLPVIPTTPLVLAASWFYVKGSQSLYKWLIESRILGKYLRTIQGNNGIPKKVRIYAITMMWTMIFLSTLMVLDHSIIIIHLIALGSIGTITMVLFKRKDDSESKN
jgi:uncharacterized membrane protein YbaN (DUF454 family)